MLTGTEPRAFHRDQTKLVLSELAGFFYRQRLFIIVAALAVSSASIALSYLIPPVYTAAGSIVVERSQHPLLRNQIELPGAAVEIASDVANVIRSRPVIEAVVDQLRPHERPRRPSALRDKIEQVLATLDRWGILTVLSRRERFVRRWSRSLFVEGNGDYITIALTDEDRVLAATAVNAIIDEYRRHYVDLFNMRRVLDLRQEIFIRTQSEIAAQRRSVLEDQAERPSAPSTASGQPSLRVDRTEPVATDVERNLRQRLAARARSELAAQAPSGQVPSGQISPALVLPANISSNSGLGSPAKYNTMLDQLRNVRRKLDATDTQVRTLQMELGPEHPDTRLAQETRASLGEAAADLEDELRRIAQVGAAADEAEAFKRAYNTRLDASRRRVDLIRLYTQSDTRTISIRLAERAEPPNIPSVVRLLQVIVGTVAGIVFALGAAVIRDRVNLRVHSAQGIEAILKSPVLFVLPDSNSQAKRLRR
ncbi:Wzz/FepE/Etk N-terminal domain-containing protein [Microvirga pakistanensis]|uniref:Wzz/FepE/Etk N-terminal domain-containing protein n=1 Tax=Microvirga pakistanensis TaxID=1682650 RepID=UPI0010696D06|nr:Wzz/FepE/Etk N-terminal domain-containing protein [Microvirga pakistanensis]